MWHNKKIEQILSELETNEARGLSSKEARRRFDTYGANMLPRGKKKTWWQFLFAQLKSPLVYILLIGAVLTAYLKEWVDMTVILLAVGVNVAVGFWQEFRSSNILDKLRALVLVRALVVRDGEIHEIGAEMLVPGDVILLKSGVKVPADARLLSSKHLKADEALLTGESAPVRKHEGVLEGKDVGVGDRSNMVHMGTVIARGEGKAVVTATGTQTEIGKIAALTEQAKDEATPLQIRIGKLGRTLAILIGFASIVIFFVGVSEGHSLKDMFTTAIAVAVAAIPEGLPAAISIVLAVSAQRILKRKGVVKQLVAAETLGSASVICTDKTGTLTEGVMKVEHVLAADQETLVYEALALANEAVLEKIKDEVLVRGETTDRAKMEAFLAHGGDLGALLSTYPRIDLLQFDPARKYIASLHETPKKDEYLLYVTGAPETVLDSSVQVAGEAGLEPLLIDRRKEFEGMYKEWAGKGYRLIGLAKKDIPASEFPRQSNIDLEDEETHTRLIKDLVFIGFVAIRDPIREDVKESIRISREAGVRPIMLTGDHRLTAQAIGKELGFNVSSEDFVMEGTQMEQMSDAELEAKLRRVEVFARVNPSHKMRIIDILQKQGEVVAMTGDGVNDAPALKASDIGVALDSGTDVAKEASDLILLNNSFSVIVAAIKQGRIAFDNIRKVTVFLLVQSFTELVLILAALVLQMPLPLVAVQILWTNLVEDSFPNVALSFEPGEKDIMKRKPLKKNEPILDTESKFIVFAVGLFTDLILLGVFIFLYHYSSLSLEYIRTFIFAAVGLDSFFYIYSIKSLRKPIFTYNLFDNWYLVGATVLGVTAMVAAIYVPVLNTLVKTVPLAGIDWIVLVGLGILKIIGIEFVKWWFVWRK